MNYSSRIYSLSENAMTVQLPSVISKDQMKYLYELKTRIQAAKIPSVSQIIITFHEITLFYNPMDLSFELLREEVQSILASEYDPVSIDRPNSTFYIPICYDESFAMDKDRLETQSGLPFQEIASIHHQSIYQVYMIGFLPGFLYLGGLNPRLKCPRLTRPRKSVPAGSVGIADQQTGIYPMKSPGGWNIIGQTPLLLFDPASEDQIGSENMDLKNVKIHPMDFINFDPVPWENFSQYKGMTIGEYQKHRNST